MSDLLELGVTNAAASVRAGALTSTALVRACLDRIAATDEAIRGWTTVDGDGAMAAAEALDADLGRGVLRGPLHGIPIGIKDVIDVAGSPTTAGAPAFAHTLPSRDATLVARLRDAGAVILGKTAATPFAFKDPPPTRNPWDLERTPGGSSSGSAAAVAARQVPAAIGTQTVGSILRPAAFCGVVGLKGAFGAVPMAGAFPLAASFDHAGPITRSVVDAALLESVLEGAALDLDGEGRPLRFAVATDLLELAEPDHRARIDAFLDALDGEVERLRLPIPLEDLMPAGRVILEAEAAAAHADLFARHGGDYPPEIAALVRAGLERSGAEVAVARVAVDRWSAAVLPLLGAFDALLSPVVPGPPPLARDGTGDFRLCAPWSYIGQPAITVPIGVDALGLPIGLQLAGTSGGLGRLLGAAARIEGLVRI